MASTSNNSNWVVYEERQSPNWSKYRKVVPITATRVRGSFIVYTTEGALTCEDGYLCMDSKGYYYPVAADEFEATYVPVHDYLEKR